MSCSQRERGIDIVVVPSPVSVLGALKSQGVVLVWVTLGHASKSNGKINNPPGRLTKDGKSQIVSGVREGGEGE